MSKNDLTVFLVDDDPVILDGLTVLLEGHGLRVEGFASANEFLAGCAAGRRGCAVIDLRMPGMDGIQLQEEMSQRGVLLPIIFLSGQTDTPTTVRAIKSGAVDFLTKPVTSEALLASIRAAFETGKTRWYEAEIRTNAASRLMHLTAREHDVMQLTIGGKANKEIARQLGISYRTVEIHRARVMQKTGAASLQELIEMAKTAQSGRQVGEVGVLAPQNGPVDSDELVLRLQWKADYACSEPSIDKEHRKLFQLANILFNHAIGASVTKPEFNAAFDALLLHVVEHFAHEEEILRVRRYEHLDEHVKQHKLLVERAMQLRQQADAASVSIGELFDFLVSEVVVAHMLREDRKFYCLFSGRRLSEHFGPG